MTFMKGRLCSNRSSASDNFPSRSLYLTLVQILFQHKGNAELSAFISDVGSGKGLKLLFQMALFFFSFLMQSVHLSSYYRAPTKLPPLEHKLMLSNRLPLK